MRIPSVSARYCSSSPRYKTTVTTAPSFNKQPSFGVNFDYLYKKSLSYHNAGILRTNVSQIEKYFEKSGIPAFFREGTDYGKKMVAYGCYHASEIFKQMSYQRPTYLGMIDFRRIPQENVHNATGLCASFPNVVSPTEVYPIRSVLFNTFSDNIPTVIDGAEIQLNWENFFTVVQHSKDTNFLSAGHFLSPFIHEFAHSLHNHHLFSKFGAPVADAGYAYNPYISNLYAKLNVNLDKNNPFVSTSISNLISQDVSSYGATNLMETFAEAFTKDVLSCIDMFTLRLTKNPFSSTNRNPVLTQVLSETFEGLVGDGAGLI